MVETPLRVSEKWAKMGDFATDSRRFISREDCRKKACTFMYTYPSGSTTTANHGVTCA